MLLDMEGITVHYGKSLAVKDVSLHVPEGAVVSIIGANGSGKSTVLRALVGLTALSAGTIRYKGNLINGRSTTDIVKQGIVLVPEGRQLFPYLTVLSNLKLGASLRKGPPRRGSRTGIPPLPRPRAETKPEGRHLERGRAADARHRQGSHGQADSPVHG